VGRSFEVLGAQESGDSVSQVDYIITGKQFSQIINGFIEGVALRSLGWVGEGRFTVGVMGDRQAFIFPVKACGNISDLGEEMFSAGSCFRRGRLEGLLL
jgi:hypothetical protein